MGLLLRNGEIGNEGGVNEEGRKSEGFPKLAEGGDRVVVPPRPPPPPGVPGEHLEGLGAQPRRPTESRHGTVSDRHVESKAHGLLTILDGKEKMLLFRFGSALAGVAKWQTRETQNLKWLRPRGGSSPPSGTNLKPAYLKHDTHRESGGSQRPAWDQVPGLKVPSLPPRRFLASSPLRHQFNPRTPARYPPRKWGFTAAGLERSSRLKSSILPDRKSVV